MDSRMMQLHNSTNVTVSFDALVINYGPKRFSIRNGVDVTTWSSNLTR